MLGKRIDHNDLESIDPEYHKSLVWMLENDIDGVIDLTFSTERDDFGVIETIDLIPNGRNVAVTNENKGEYVRLITDQRLSVDIKEQMDVSCTSSKRLENILTARGSYFLGHAQGIVRDCTQGSASYLLRERAGASHFRSA